jgi:hypothetical protein
MNLQCPAFLGTVILIKPVQYVYMRESIEPQQRILIFIKNFDPDVVSAIPDNPHRFEIKG